MESLEFRYGSARAQNARIGRQLAGTTRQLLFVLAVVLFLAGLGFVAFSYAFGWLLAGLAALPYMAMRWYDIGLKHIPARRPGRTLDDVLSGDVLGFLPPNPTASDIATAAGSVTSGQFLGARFGITARLIDEIGAAEMVDARTVWQHAVNLRETLGEERIGAPILVMALFRSLPNYETILAHLHLDEEDLVEGLRWHEHIRQLIERSGRPKRTGGVGRDWSFGYIPTLTRFGQNISEQIARGSIMAQPLESHSEALDQLIGTFSGGGRQNVTLVGTAGVGKTTIVQAFAERLLDATQPLPTSLKFNQVIMLDASALVSAAAGRGEIEGLITQVLNEAFLAKNIIICLDNAQLFFEEGVGSVDLSNLLLPILEAGRLRMILTMDEQRYLAISQRNPALINALNRVAVPPASYQETLRVMQDQLIMTEFERKVTYTYQALKESYRLSERYVHDLAMPGRAIKLMESAASYAESGLVTINSVQQAIEKTMDVKVSVASDTDDRDKLLNLEQLIHERMINQTRAVEVVSDALRRARAGVRSQNRPIGTFLFLGPTGVGKTELSKALADVYFGGEDRIVRLDLNEYVRNEDVARLIADGASDPSSLTAQIMKQPFSVVLLDEIEKAHPAVLATLLQLLDEGIMRDINNKEVSFRDAIVIATSNAGADRIREYIERGYQLQQFEQQFHDELISSNQFRPEFLNRFDEIVTFTPLSKEDLLQVIDLILAGINKTLALQKVSVTLDERAKQLVVDRGYDPRLGARPMRRVMQKAVENTVAKAMLSGQVAPGGTVEITYEQVEQILGSQAQAAQIVSGDSVPPETPAA